MRFPLLPIALCASAGQAFAAQTIEVKGKTGYLSEYEIAAKLTEQTTDGKKEFVGPMTVTHVGLCAHDGPDVFTSEIKLHVGWFSKVDAKFDFEGAACAFRGSLSESSIGVMSCAGKPDLPFTLWRK
jgi:hypothetical protein